ncbi:nucleotidyltransferase domain-containing protein [Petropleomorpha daqingensis]|uniref:Putative nucleotidyltransferase n=1 Tax=Petropleomorpha daqingensis TaxID=2026353 RepID=A0A853CJ38_9ACTN|nr:putative nucleotidyltransferase [Petropleomorpha daqingensis]
MQHHDDTLAGFVARESARDDAVAVVVTGSVARGTPRPDSDVDVYLVVGEERFRTAWETGLVSYVDSAVATYEGGYVDVKLATVEFLRRAVEAADDPTRASFLTARVAWSRDPSIEELVAAIPQLPDDAWAERGRAFLAQLRLYVRYFLLQGEAHDNTYLRSWAAVHAVNAGGRALLALNRTLFQGPKYLEETVPGLPRVPAGYAELAAALLREPTAAHGRAYAEAIEGLHDWDLDRDATLSRFVRDNELAWLTGAVPPEFS